MQLWEESYEGVNSIKKEFYRQFFFWSHNVCAVTALQITVGHQQLSMVWEYWSAKKNLEITKMTDHFSHTHTKRILKLPNLKDLFFLIYYSTPLKLLSEFRYTRNVYSPYSCMNVELEWIAHSWKQFLFFLKP